MLSAVVVSVVGWFLLQQTREGLLDHRVSAVVAEANNETTEARARLAAAPGTDIDSASQQRDLVEPIIQRGATRGFSVVLAGPVGASGGRIADGGAQFTPGLDTASVPASLEEHFDEPAAHRLDLHRTIRTTDRRHGAVSRAARTPGHRGRAPRSGCPPTARRTRSTTSSRSTRSRRRWRWSPARC